MKYPAWFPFPQSWLRAAILFLSLLPIMFIWWIFAPILELPSRLEIQRSKLALDILAYWFLILGVLAPVAINAWIDLWVWNKPNPERRFLRWFPRWNSWLEGGYAWLGFLLCLVLVFGVDLVLTDAWQNVYYFEERAKVLMAIVFIICAYWFQLRHRFVGEVTDLRTRWAKGEARYQRRFTGKKSQPNPPRSKVQSPKPQSKSVKPPAPASNIDAELERLRREMGKD
jgi:hypothetical protein